MAAACIIRHALARAACKFDAPAGGHRARCWGRKAAGAALRVLLLFERPVPPRPGEQATDAVARARLQTDGSRRTRVSAPGPAVAGGGRASKQAGAPLQEHTQPYSLPNQHAWQPGICHNPTCSRATATASTRTAAAATSIPKATPTGLRLAAGELPAWVASALRGGCCGCGCCCGNCCGCCDCCCACSGCACCACFSCCGCGSCGCGCSSVTHVSCC